MSSANGDLFVKIDALLEKHDPDALIDRGLEHEDFPVLDEVIEVAPGQSASQDGRGTERRQPDHAQGVPCTGELGADAAQTAAPLAQPAALDDAHVSRLLAGLAERIEVLFDRQQQRTEALVRRIVREELDRRDTT